MLRLVIIICVLFVLYRFLVARLMKILLDRYIANQKEQFYSQNPHLKNCIKTDFCNEEDRKFTFKNRKSKKRSILN